MTGSLRELVVVFADYPTTGNRDTFYRALLTALVAVPLRTVPFGIAPGMELVAAGQQWSVPTTHGPDGGPMLFVYTDPQAAMQAPGAKAAFSIAGRVVLEMALANRAGVIVATGYGAAGSWAGVAREHVGKLLAEQRDLGESPSGVDSQEKQSPRNS
jgi:hypothetical protein